MSQAASAENTTDTSRRFLVRVLLILVAITVVAGVFTGVYLFTRTSYAGKWVGPGNVQGTGDPSAIVALLALEQNPLGGISGTGTVCAANGNTLTRIPLTVSGKLVGSTASLTLHASGGDAAIFPATLAAEGTLSQGQLTLSADAPAHLLLTLQHGNASDFDAACNQLVQPTQT